MAVAKKAPEKEKGNKPDFVIRARQAVGSDFFVNVGAAWAVTVNGEEAYSVKITNMPVAWDGSCLMLKPKEE